MTSTKITSIIYAGLGNQLFMIFTGLSKAMDENREFSVFPIISNGHRGYYFSSLLKKLMFKIEDRMENVQQRIGYEELNFHFNEIPKEALTLKGYFQSHKYFNHNKDKIVKYLELDKFQNRYQFIDDYVMIHFRFEDNIINQANHIHLGPDYYINALLKFLNLVPNATEKYKFLIFCIDNDDDIVNDYIDEITKEIYNKTNIKIDFIKIYDIKPNLKDHQELMYMTSCKHFIIANSSFSWFGAYLSNNKDALILYPDEWFGPNLKNEKNIKDLFPEHWIKIKAI